MKTRKLSSFILSLALVLGLGAVARINSASAGEQKGDYLFYFVAMDSTSQYWMNMFEGAKQAAGEVGGVRVEFMSPEKKDDAMQIEMINNAVANGAQLILLAANGPDVLVSTIKRATNDGVKFIYVDSPANYDAVATICTNNFAGGEKVGELARAELAARGITSGKIGVVGVAPSIASTTAREEGFKKAFEGSNFEFIATQYCNSDVAQAKDITDGYLVEGAVCVFGTNDNSANGVGASLRANDAQANVVGFGFDTNDAIKEYLDRGFLVGTAVQNERFMCAEGVRIGVKAMKGEKIAESFIDSGVEIIKGAAAKTK